MCIRPIFSVLVTLVSINASSDVTFLDTLPHRRGLTPCAKKDETDSSIEQCQDWCKYPNQCEFCKCRACSMCKRCSSNEEGDTPFESCEDWCSVPEHCSHCKCRACSICQACSPADENDIAYKDCQSWCSGTGHCNQCKCKGCPICKAQCTPYNHDDDDFISCQSWCHTEAYHCPYCKCKKCPVCADRCMDWCSTESDCTSKGCQGCPLCEHAAVAMLSKCEPWCQKSNCRKSNCAGCKFCEELGDAIPCSSGLKSDVEFEECTSWCSEGYSSAHCKFCACRRCMFCAPLTSAIPSIKETSTPCPPFEASDATTMRCEPFCKESHLDIHCDLCKCKACKFCPARLDTGIACTSRSGDDSLTIKCEPFCSMAHSEAHCAMCKCAGCSFCIDESNAELNITAALLARLRAQAHRPPARVMPPPLNAPVPIATSPPTSNGVTALPSAIPPLAASTELCPWLESISWEPNTPGEQRKTLRLVLSEWPSKGGQLVVVPTPALDRKAKVHLRFDAASATPGGTAAIRPSAAPGIKWLTALSESQAQAVVRKAASRLEWDRRESMNSGNEKAFTTLNSESSDVAMLMTATSGVALAAAFSSNDEESTPPSLLIVTAKELLTDPVAVACSDGFVTPGTSVPPSAASSNEIQSSPPSSPSEDNTEPLYSEANVHLDDGARSSIGKNTMDSPRSYTNDDMQSDFSDVTLTTGVPDTINSRPAHDTLTDRLPLSLNSFLACGLLVLGIWSMTKHLGLLPSSGYRSQRLPTEDTDDDPGIECCDATSDNESEKSASRVKGIAGVRAVNTSRDLKWIDDDDSTVVEQLPDVPHQCGMAPFAGRTPDLD